MSERHGTPSISSVEEDMVALNEGEITAAGIIGTVKATRTSLSA